MNKNYSLCIRNKNVQNSILFRLCSDFSVDFTKNLGVPVITCDESVIMPDIVAFLYGTRCVYSPGYRVV